MQKKINQLARQTSLDYNIVINLLDDSFAKSTQSFVADFYVILKKNNYFCSNDMNSERINEYQALYNGNLEILKEKLLKVANSRLLRLFLEYNNKFLFSELNSLENIQDKQKINNFYKSISAYINRLALNPVHGGFSGVYSKIYFSRNNAVAKNNRVKLKILEQKISLSLKKCEGDNVCINPTIFTQDNNTIYFRFKDNAEEIIKIKDIDSATLFNKFKINGKVNKLIDAGIVNKSFSDLNSNCFSKYRFINKYSSLVDERLRIKDNYVYDLVNCNRLIVNSDIVRNFDLAASTYLSFLKKQLLSLQNEKKIIGNILIKYLNNTGKDSCLLLDFIVRFKDEIEKIRNNRVDFDKFFEDQVYSSMSKDSLVWQNRKIIADKTIGNFEFYFSIHKVDNKELYYFENISPSGIFSSRLDYLFKQSKGKGYAKDKLEPLEIIFAPQDHKLYHAYRRRKTTTYYLNINQFVKSSSRYLININEIELVFDDDYCPTIYCKRLNKRFDPVIHSTLSASDSIILIFLRMISRSQEEVYELPRFLPTNNEATDLPRLIVNNVIISSRKWCFQLSELNIIKGSAPSADEFISIISKLLDRKVPRFFKIVCHGEDPRIIDMYNPFSLLQIKKYKNCEFIYLEEILPFTCDTLNCPNNYLIQYLF
jgi:hypothetical protein